jgi:hypothetical protein
MIPPNRRYSPNTQPIVSTRENQPVPSTKNSSLMRMEFRISPKISRSSASKAYKQKFTGNRQTISQLER